MRRHASGARRGARGCASHAHLREASGSRPLQLRGAAFDGWTGTGEGRRKLPRWGGRRVLRLVPGSTAPGTEIAAVERREARRTDRKVCPAPQGADEWRKLRTLVCAGAEMLKRLPGAPLPSFYGEAK